VKTIIKVLIAILSTSLFLTGCPNNTGSIDIIDELAGKLLILQAYGNGPMDGNSPGGVSHSFVELYNTTDEEINLDGIVLYYADGTSTSTSDNTATEDEPWKRISLDGKTIPAGASFLVLGKKHTDISSTRFIIGDNYGDINDDNFILSRRAFKVALIRSTKTLTVQNPFNIDRDGKKADGYIDMVGAANEYSDNINGRDRINGFEYRPARNSASESVRRVDIDDYDDNFMDFESIRYAIGDSSTGNKSISDEMLEVRKPRNSNTGAWNPFEEPDEGPTPPPPEGPFVKIGTQDTLAEKLLILQAYGSSSDAVGVSHSFVELYNTTSNAINLTGITLYYADGTRGLPKADNDGDWKKLALTGSIPAKASYLILGPKQNTSGRYQVPVNSGDINNSSFMLSNRSFKVVLIRNDATLTAQNPFNMDGKGAKAAGYIDMVGAANDPTHATNPDQILGFETAPARNSASEAVRRKDLNDTNNNSTDFIAARYALTGSGAFTDEMLELRKPRNSKVGEWDPFAELEEEPGEEPGEDPGEEPPPEGLIVEAGTQDSLAGKLLILQAYGSSSDAAGVSHSFVELYNTTNTAIPLAGITLYYADGTRGLPKADKDGDWKKLALTGSIPAGASYLILGPRQSPTAARYQIPDNYGDINDPGFTLGNRSFKVAIIHNDAKLIAQNPFNMGSGAKAAGYIDMVGAANDLDHATNPDQILGFETAPARNSASEAVRRINLTDTDNNRGPSTTYPSATGDFTSLRYATGTGTISAELLEVRKPRNSTACAWNPFAEPLPPPEGTERLMILQANTYGNNNGGAAGFGKSLVELYNNTNNNIDFNTDTYYLHIGDGTTWTSAIKLAGVIPARSSFLIVTTKETEVNATPRAALPIADQEADFAIANNNFKVALMKNQASLSVDNPFTESSLTSDYVDMLGVGTANGFETQAASTSRPQGPRRTSLADTDNNKEDFAQADYRGQSGSNGMSDEDLLKYWPRNSAAGAWDPITGESL
jgi:hypothetical protein